MPDETLGGPKAAPDLCDAAQRYVCISEFALATSRTKEFINAEEFYCHDSQSFQF